MNVKKSLELRIRGWFPQEPRLIGMCVKASPEVKQQPLVIPPEYDLSATLLTGVSAILFGFMGLPLNLLGLFFNHSLPHVFWFSVFLAVGAFLGFVGTKNQLNQLSRDYKISQNASNAKLIIVFLVPLTVAFFLYYMFMGFPSGEMFVFFVCTSSFWMSRWLLMRAYEKRENMRLMQSLWGSFLIAIPNPPNSNE
jgi:hypothetical protein